MLRVAAVAWHLSLECHSGIDPGFVNFRVGIAVCASKRGADTRRSDCLKMLRRTYPLRPLLSDFGRDDVILRLVEPRNLSRRLSKAKPEDEILAMHTDVSGEVMVNKTSYVEVWRERNLTLLGKQP